ncbi:MAG: hypothetical protein ACXVB9_18570 [Bdellovibrionota bacterium]
MQTELTLRWIRPTAHSTKRELVMTGTENNKNLESPSSRIETILLHSLAYIGIGACVLFVFAACVVWYFS